MGAPMYSSFPKNDRIRIRVALSLAWGFVAFGGLSGVFAPTAFQLDVGYVIPIFSSLIIAVFATVAAIGVALNRYWMEWVAAWPSLGGVFGYSIYVWYLSFTSGNLRFQAAALLTALLFFFVYRIVANSAHAKKQRSIHDLIQSGETDDPDA